MANVTVKINRSDVFPVGTVVSIFAGVGVHGGLRRRPAGTALSTPTVAADGSLTFTVPAGSTWTAYAEVAEAHRMVYGGDPTPPSALGPLTSGTLRDRVKRNRVLANTGKL